VRHRHEPVKRDKGSQDNGINHEIGSLEGRIFPSPLAGSVSSSPALGRGES
jgi:hypothetical protein